MAIHLIFINVPSSYLTTFDWRQVKVAKYPSFIHRVPHIYSVDENDHDFQFDGQII